MLTETLLAEAGARRVRLIADLTSELTDCYRLFHGATEGRPGLTLDRYGSVLLAQTWGETLHPDELRVVLDSAGELTPVYNHRGTPVDFPAHFPIEPFDAVGQELGMTYDARPRHRGQDPLLFLDFRAARRRVRMEARGRSLLNLFSYTCTMGQIAHSNGAAEVLNVDFARSSLDVGRGNVERNDSGTGTLEFFQSDCLPALWQLGGRTLPKRRGRSPYIAPRTFDVVVLDPPRLSKGRFGTVDVVRDYPTLLKPCAAVCNPGGNILATNHVPSVDLDDWIEVVRSTIEKAGRELDDLEILEPESDFVSFDGRHPLKMAWLTLR